MSELKALAQQLVTRCLDAGATAAEIYLSEGTESEVSVRDGVVDTLTSGQPRSVGIRVWRKNRSASTTGTDFSEATLKTLIDDAVELAKLSDPVDGITLAPKDRLAKQIPDLDLFDSTHLQRSMDEKIALAVAAEKAAMTADERITVSGGASYSDGTHHYALATSDGFAGEAKSSWAAMGVQVIADDSDHRKRNGSWYSVARFADGLLPPEEIGQRAAKRAVEQLGAGPIPTETLPVVFDPYMAASLFGALFGAISGGAIERGSSYLADAEGTAIASPLVTLIDDPTLPRALGSRPFDGEGLPSKRTVFIQDGVLQSFALNTYSANKLGRTPTGHASRPSSGAPGEGASNLFIQPGAASPDELIAGVKRGFYCQSMMGFGFNPATGDFSRGATGFLIEDGKLTRPVSEVTLSGNYKEMLMNIDGVANDLVMDRSVCSPTLRIRSMTLAGT